MPNKTIYLSQELLEQCKTINASEVISRLLRDYFSLKKSKSELLNEAEIIKKEKDLIIAEKEKQENKIMLEVKKVESIEEETKNLEEERMHKRADKISNCINNTMDIFNIELTEEQASEFLDDKTKKYKTIKDYLQAKNMI